MKKKLEEQPEKKIVPPEKFFAKAVGVFFGFHKDHFRDEDGYPLSPNWNDGKRGMEMKGLKMILTTLREICEGKGAEWTEQRMIDDFNRFLERANEKPFLRKNFLCCMLNRYKFDILSSSYTPALTKKILNVWYKKFPDYTSDEPRDKTAAEIMIGFLKQQHLKAGIAFTDDTVMSSVEIIFAHIAIDKFWSKKSLRSIANNLQEFVTKIKSEKNGTSKSGFTREGVNQEFNRRNYAARQSGYNASGQDGNKPGTEKI